VSIRTEPVKYSAEPLVDGCEPLRVICIVPVLTARWGAVATEARLH
jgi:hypothetical protein